MGKCVICKRDSNIISTTIGYCLSCIRKNFDEAWPSIEKTHQHSRKIFKLPSKAPTSKEGLACNLCLNACRMEEGDISYCGLRSNQGGNIRGVSAEEGNLSWYYDSLPTNCVADWVCPGGTGAGYPKYAYRKGPEYGFKNLAVFYQACSFNCLFCQNWHYRNEVFNKRRVSTKQLAEAVDKDTACICFFGGDPTPQIHHALLTSHIALEKKKSNILRICWETNGGMSPEYLDEMVNLSSSSGGCVKFDLKTYSEELSYVLCGASNQRTLNNFRRVAERIKERPVPPLLIASTLLIPGYIDENEVGAISRYIVDINPHIPYALLAFYPQFYLSDLPTTSRNHAIKCKEIAEKMGLRNVKIGNLHLLSDTY
jgi:pyruvate formate lyase activating enzyme